MASNIEVDLIRGPDILWSLRKLLPASAERHYFVIGKLPLPKRSAVDFSRIDTRTDVQDGHTLRTKHTHRPFFVDQHAIDKQIDVRSRITDDHHVPAIRADQSNWHSQTQGQVTMIRSECELQLRRAIHFRQLECKQLRVRCVLQYGQPRRHILRRCPEAECQAHDACRKPGLVFNRQRKKTTPINGRLRDGILPVIVLRETFDRQPER